ncbi:MAG TPA: cation-transporting P-type ATPase [Nitrospiria bacterium]|nr:cation-transporting P-type ATPase [Nitrospiria bacterium]
MKLHQLTVEEALKSLHSSPSGLSFSEADRRLKEFGPNRIEQIRQTHPVVVFLKGFTHFFALILWIASFLAFFAEWNEPGKGMGTLGIAILGVVFVNGLFSFWQEYRAEKAIATLRKLLPHEVNVLRNHHGLRIPSEALVPGDIIRLEGGDHIPADCRLIEAFGVRVILANLTGEPVPEARDAAPGKEEDFTQSKNILLAGTLMVSGESMAVVFSTGMNTEFGKIAHLTQAADERLSPFQKEIIFLSRVIALIALGLGGIFFITGEILGFPFWGNIIFAIGIIVANVPEGLLPTVTLALAMSSQRMARRNILIRHLPSVETLGSTTVICTDKTGTLTQNKMEIKSLFLSGHFITLSEVNTPGSNAVGDSYRHFFEGASLCHNLKETEAEGKTTFLGDPMEISLIQMAEKRNPETPAYRRLDEIPFDSDRKRLSILFQTPENRILHTKGALEALLTICSEVRIGSGLAPLTDALKENLLKVQNTMADEGLRVLAFAYRLLPENEESHKLEENMILSGIVGLEDPPRPEVPGAIEKCRTAGIRVIMTTGDHPHTARAIAKEIGLTRSTTPLLITGEQLQRLSNAQLQLVLDTPEVIFARVGANQKMQIVSALQAKKEVVAVTGDGVNDAPALRKADIGIAMGISGTDVARESSDMVLMDDNFASIVAAIEEGRAVFENIRKFLTYILTHELPEIVPYLAFAIFRIPLPLTIIQILAIDLGTDTLPALALGAEKPSALIMQKPPRSLKERLISWPLILRAYLFLGVVETAGAMAAFFFVLQDGHWKYGTPLSGDVFLYRQATTACLSAIILLQIVNMFLCRSERASAFGAGFLNNPWLLLGLILPIAMIAVIDYTPWGNLVFGTAPLPGKVWLFIVPFALGMLVLEELRKGWVRRKGPGISGTAG